MGEGLGNGGEAESAGHRVSADRPVDQGDEVRGKDARSQGERAACEQGGDVNVEPHGSLQEAAGSGKREAGSGESERERREEKAEVERKDGTTKGGRKATF